MKKILFAAIALLALNPGYAQKISNLPAASGVTADDLTEITNDPAGTPASQKATAAQWKAFVRGDFSAFMDTLVDDANAAAARTTLGAGDASTNTSSSVDSEFALFSSTGGKTLKRATGTGLALSTSGVFSALAVTDDSVPVANGSTYQVKTLTDCDGATNAVTYDTATNAFGCNTISAGGTPGGSNTQIQFNDSSAFGGDADFTWNKTSNVLSVLSGGATLQLGAFAGTGNILGINASGGNNGGDLLVQAGQGGTGGARGGNLTISGGAAASGGEQGSLTLSSGTGGSTAADVHIATNGATRITFDGDGSWDLAGSSPGSSGQAIVSNGSSSAPTFQSVGLLGSTQTWTGNQTWSGTNPRLYLNESDQGADAKLWEWGVDGLTYYLRTRTDADGTGRNVITATRTTIGTSGMTFGDAAGSTLFTFAGTGGTVTTAAASAARFVVTGASVPTVGTYLPGTNRYGFSTATTYRGEFDASGQFIIGTTGAGLSIKEGSNAKMGTCTLAAGTCTVSTTAVTANSRIFYDVQLAGGTQGFLNISAKTAATSFVITSTSALETSVVAWMLVEPSP